MTSDIRELRRSCVAGGPVWQLFDHYDSARKENADLRRHLDEKNAEIERLDGEVELHIATIARLTRENETIPILREGQRRSAATVAHLGTLLGIGQRAFARLTRELKAVEKFTQERLKPSGPHNDATRDVGFQTGYQWAQTQLQRRIAAAKAKVAHDENCDAMDSHPGMVLTKPCNCGAAKPFDPNSPEGDPTA
jgi:hypothetical protein